MPSAAPSWSVWINPDLEDYSPFISLPFPICVLVLGKEETPTHLGEQRSVMSRHKLLGSTVLEQRHRYKLSEPASVCLTPTAFTIPSLEESRGPLC